MTLGACLLSVVIPTRNRTPYAVAAVRQVLKYTSGDVEVVVQDNSASRELEVALGETLDDVRVSYEQSDAELSFSANFDRAVERSRGRYVCIIGDDDGVLPSLEPVVRYADSVGLQAVTPSLDAVYYWPGSMTGERSHLDASLVLQAPRLRATVRDPRPQVSELLRRGAVGYLSLPMVKIYHGVVSRDLLEAARERTGRFFGGLSPDIYSSTVLSQLARSVLVAQWPLTLPGVCATSGSADSASGRHTGRLEQAPHFRGHRDYAWATAVPSVYSVETIWADSALAALRDLGVPADVFAPEVLRRTVRRRHPSLRAVVESPRGLTGAWGSGRVVVDEQRARVVHRARRLLHGQTIVSDLDTISDAVAACSLAHQAAGLGTDRMVDCVAAAVRSG